MTKRQASKHHKKHGDMHGKLCLLAKCPLHYPRTTYIRSGRRIIVLTVTGFDPAAERKPPR